MPDVLGPLVKWYTGLFAVAMQLLKNSEKIKDNYNLVVSETEDKTSTARQVLMLRTLGVLDTNLGLSQNKLSEFLGVLLNRNGQTVKEALIGDMKKVRTSQNIDFVLTQFEKFNMPTGEVLKLKSKD